jgi:hypothetical protein
MGFGFWFCLTGERVARGRMNDCWSTLYCGAMSVPLLHANNDETPLTTLPRLDHSGGAVWRRMARIGVGKLLSLLTFFAAAKKVSPAPDRGRANKPTRKQVPWKPERIKRLNPDPDPDRPRPLAITRPAPDRGRANRPTRNQVPWKPERIKRCKSTVTEKPRNGKARSPATSTPRVAQKPTDTRETMSRTRKK